MSKILLVEDDSITRLLLKRDLHLAGYEVSVAKNGEEGLQQAMQLRPALIICDWLMPVMDGLQLCRYVKASPELANIFFILLTVREAIADRVEGLDAGADDFLSKPVNLNELLARVRAGLRLYQYQQDLSEANQQLSCTLRDLQRTQAQLVQSEKMSSLGQLVAGVAHEINNPLGIIEGNLAHATNYLTRLLGLMQLYQNHYPNPGEEIENYAEENDCKFIASDFPKVLESMGSGTSRINEIVLSLRNFSRLDEAEMKFVDVHEGLDSTLLVLQHRLQATGQHRGIQVIKEYGDVPQVECYPRQLNQVFLNILNNAIDAIKYKGMILQAACEKTRALVEETETPNSSGEISLKELSNAKQTLANMKSFTQKNSIMATEEFTVATLDALNSPPEEILPVTGDETAAFQDDEESKFNTDNAPESLASSYVPRITVHTQVVTSQSQELTDTGQPTIDQVVIRITDNGAGMTELTQKQLFDPFFTTKPVGKGTGLGLSISYQIVVQHHGGNLDYQSELGQGTDFFIKIPVRQPQLFNSI
ncbi:MAG: hybrid sensor histidine kinase/response regulator [Microcoleus sp. SIO2G3]|nr:hybrid sensor histidine kinase/response regulator [Microcoleus sp. SIO2G3]